MNMWVFTWTFMLVGLENAKFIMNHKFTEKRQNNCKTKKKLMTDVHIERRLGYCGKNTKGGSKGDVEENRTQPKLRANYGPFCQKLSKPRIPVDLWEG